MPDRWPPMVGVVGFDSGYRPAVSLALPSAELTSDEGTPDEVGACCYDDGTCDDLTVSECEAAGGHYQGPGTVCDDTDCSHGGGGTSGACCVGIDCSITSPLGCFEAIGIYQGDGTDCDPNPCGEVTGACCVGTDCTSETAASCADLGGIFSPNINCDPTPCCTYCEAVTWQGCTDGDGNCRTGPENCDGCTGAIVPCDDIFNWYTDTEYCITCPGGGLEVCNVTSVDLLTCEQTSPCPECCDCPDPASGSTHAMSIQVPPCGACCIMGECSILPEDACIGAGGTWVGAGSDCIIDPC